MTTPARITLTCPPCARRGARSASLERLLAALLALPPEARREGWRVYRRLRRASDSEALLEAPEPLLALCVGCAQGSENRRLAVAIALKLAQRRLVETLQAAARHEPLARVRRLLLEEAFFLLRRALRVHLGLRSDTPDPELVLQASRTTQGPLLSEPDAPGWLLVCDGSARPRACGAGVALFDAQGVLRATVSLALPASSAVSVELAATRIGLLLLRAFEVRHAQLHTDCLAVLRAFEGTLHGRYRPQMAELAELARALERLHVRLVPRTQTRLADALAAGRAA